MDLVHEACLIDGEWVTGNDWIAVDDPATGSVIGRVPAFGAAEAERAVRAAERALPDWRAKTAKERAGILRRFYDLLIRHADTLAAILTREQGKPIAEARGEILYAASFLEWFAEEAKRAYGEVIPGHMADKRIIVTKQPVGVVAAITPWNFPAAMVTRKVAPALAAGCTVVVKPAELTPFTALAIGQLALEAGVPRGVINIVTGDAAEIGRVLTESPVVRKISFTGSTATGAKLYGQSAATIKKLSLELGGNAPFIVFDDADLASAVEGAIQSKFRNAGQTCVCANRIYVQAGIRPAFVDALKAAVSALPVGPGDDPATAVGPLIDERAVAKVRGHIEDALLHGGRLVIGGERDRRGGCFFQPTIVDGATSRMKVATEETFGPLAAIFPFDTELEVISLANDTEFGLAAYVYSRDIARIFRVTEALEVGMIGVNTGLISTEAAPFGGIKASGLGREGSRHGLDDYLELKYLCLSI